MNLLAFIVHTSALVLAVAGAAKLADPTPTARSLSMARLPSSLLVGRLLGAGEVAVGIAVLAVGGRWSALALGLWYLGFVAYLIANRVRGLDVPCGCIGETDRPSGPAHLGVDVVAAGGALAAVIWPVGDATAWLDQGIGGWVGLVAVIGTSAAVVAFVLRS